MEAQLEKPKQQGGSVCQLSRVILSTMDPEPGLTIFELLQLSGLHKVGLDGLKPPEEFGNEHHHVLLRVEQ